MLHKNWLVATLASLFLLSTVGCGQGFQTASGKPVGLQSSNAVGSPAASTIDAQVAKAQQASNSAQTALAAAQTVIATITDANGNIDLSLVQLALGGTSTTTTSGLLNPLLTKLQTAFSQIYSQATLVKTQFESAKATLTSTLATLNASDPTQAQEITQLTNMLAQVTTYETQFDSEMQALATKVGAASTAITNLVNTETSKIPNGLGIIAGIAIDYLVVDDIQTALTGFQTKLQAL